MDEEDGVEELVLGETGPFLLRLSFRPVGPPLSHSTSISSLMYRQMRISTCAQQ